MASLVVDCTVKNYTAGATETYMSCEDHFHRYEHPLFKYCLKLFLPTELKREAARIKAGYVGVRLTLFLHNVAYVPLQSPVTGLKVNQCCSTHFSADKDTLAFVGWSPKLHG